MQIFRTIWKYMSHHAVVTVSVGVLVIIGMVIAGRAAGRAGQAVTNDSNVHRVSLVNAAIFRNGGTTVSADGVVESVSQADLKSQVSAPLSHLDVAIGDSVYAGQIIAELQNADIRAQLEQAKASLTLAQGQYQSGGISTDSSQRSAIDKMRDAYIKADDAVHSQVDQFLFTNSGTGPSLSSLISDAKLADRIRTTYIDITNFFGPWKKSIDALSSSPTDASVASALALSQKNTATVSGFLDDIAAAINDASKDATPALTATTNVWKASVASARSSISGAVSSLTGAQTSLGSTGAQTSVAQAGVSNLEAQLAKTIIRSPISGKIAALPLRTGELASPGALIATVVGSGDLSIKAYASSEDFARLRKGATAIVDGTIKGTVVNVAPSVNQSNKKVEVKIAIDDSASSKLVVGDSVQALVQAAPAANASGQSENVYLLPIQDIKIVPGDAYVFTVDAGSMIVKNQVLLGEVRGDFIEVKGGLTDQMDIISPVYELNEGETVEVR